MREAAIAVRESCKERASLEGWLDNVERNALDCLKRHTMVGTVGGPYPLAIHVFLVLPDGRKTVDGEGISCTDRKCGYVKFEDELYMHQNA